MIKNVVNNVTISKINIKLRKFYLYFALKSNNLDVKQSSILGLGYCIILDWQVLKLWNLDDRIKMKYQNYSFKNSKVTKFS